MKNRDEQKEIRDSLNQDVFSRYQFKSQQDKIMKKATEVSKTTKKEKYYYYGLSGVAVILFSIVALSYILTSNLDQDPSSPADQVEEEAETDQLDVNQNDYLSDPDFPLTPHQRVEPVSDDESTDPAHVDKTEEEWKAYFHDLYKDQREAVQKLHLKYESSMSLSSKTEVEISSKFEEEGFIIKESQKTYENDALTTDHSYITTNTEIIFLDHQHKTFDQEPASTTAEEWVKNRPLYTGTPVYHLHDMEFNGYSWTVVDQNLKENWVTLELVKTDPKVFLYERGLIKIEYDSGVVLEKEEYLGEDMLSTFTLKELRKNDGLPELHIDISIPEDYTDRQDLRDQQERGVIDQNLFDQAQDRVIKNNNKIQDIIFTGEDGHLYFVVTMKDGMTSTDGKAAGQEFIKEFTDVANNSESFLKRNTTIWAEGQYDFTIRVEVPATAFLYGTPEDSEIIWESKAYGEY
ncbi:hypothetical protein [Bacillus sp. P14.5]|uniref:hypothetical protein n=1 Tax=Bacillus sp. P14.5 TaxID=1983400 RepID=UPI000DE96B53|nr:hypothetical protein [Bacillus sp. P14.5]